MHFSDLFQETITALTVNKVRSGLTVLGIIIGIGSVIAMVAIGQGSQDSIESRIQSLGSNLIMVVPGAQRGPGIQVNQGRGSAQTLTKADADAIAAEITLAVGVSPELSGRYQVTARGTNTNTSVIGTIPAYPTIRNIEIGEGNFISDQDLRSRGKVAVLGPTTATDLFGEGNTGIGSTIRIKQIAFKVIGVTKAKGGSGFNNPDDTILVPLSTAQQFLSGSEFVSTISVQAGDAESMTVMQEQITTLLLDRHRISDPAVADFSTINQADIVSAASEVTGTFTILLGSVAAISLLVGGIGIMNMMLTTVTERTREIGLRKAIGAKRRDVNRQFLMEAIVLTLIGGILGIVFGWLVALTVKQFVGLASSVSLSSILLACSVSATIGIVFGYYPARRAARLSPIEALRYE